MATKKSLFFESEGFVLSGSNQNGQYKNLNLNENYKHLNKNVVQSKSISTENGRKNLVLIKTDNCKKNIFTQLKNESKLFQTTTQKTNPLAYLLSYDSDSEEGNEKERKNASKNVRNSNNSTLSLHIAAYENSVIETEKAKVPKNETISVEVKTKFSSFEFPRQQNENQMNDPEIMQFKASQRLFNPNASTSSSPSFSYRSNINWNNTVIAKLLDDFIDGKLSFINIEEFANHINQLCNTNTTSKTIQQRIYTRQRERRQQLQATAAAAAMQNEDETMESAVAETPIRVVAATAETPRMDPPSLDESDTVTYQELYQAYVNFWNSLNNCVDDEFKIIPANGVKPTFREAKNLWKSMKDPRRRKLLWVATGFTHSEFPDDEEAFRREEAAGLINDTNVATVDEESSSDDDEYDDDIPDLDEENIPPVVNIGANAQPQQNALDRLYGGNRPAEVEDISSDEEAAPQDPINANALAAANDLGLSLNGEFRPETPLLISRGAAASSVADPIPAVVSPIRSQMDSMNLDTPARNVVSPPAVAVPAQNEIVADSQPDAWVETVRDNYDIDPYMEQPDISPPRSPIRNDEVVEASQVTVESDSPVPTPQSSYPFSQAPNERKKITPKRKRVVIDDSDEEENGEVKTEAFESSYIEEQIASPPPRRPQASKSPVTTAPKGRKRKSDSPRPSTSKPRSRTRSGNNDGKQKARKTVKKRGRPSDPDYESDVSMASDNEVVVPSPMRLFNNEINELDSGKSSSDDDESFVSETNSLNGFIVDDKVNDESSDESSDEDVSLSDSQETRHSQESSSTLNDEIYTRDDSAERDLPAAPPRAILRNTPTTPKSGPFLAHVGKPRYSSDIPTTPGRRLVTTPLSFKRTPGRNINASSSTAATPQRKTATTSIKPANAPAFGHGRRRSVDPGQMRTRTPERPATAAQRTRSGERPIARTRSNQNQVPAQPLRARSAERQPAPRTRTRTNEAVKPGPSRTKRQTLSKEPPQRPAAAAPIDSRRSTSSVRFGSLIRDGGSDNSRPSSVNSMNSSIPEGYELIDRNNKLPVRNALIIITERDGKKYFRRYRLIETPGYYNQTVPCIDYYCIKCKALGKDTFVKVIKRTNNTYAEYDHDPNCEMKEYNLEDDDE